MEDIEESAINASPVAPKIWKRYVDDSFCIIKKNGVTAFHDTLNSIDTNISFTIEQECNGKISFLDTLVSCSNGAISVDVYRKPTHTDRYLDFNSHHNKKHKGSTAATLLHRALNLHLTHLKGKNANLIMFTQRWSLMAIRQNLSTIYRPKQLDHRQIYPLRNVLECFSI